MCDKHYIKLRVAWLLGHSVELGFIISVAGNADMQVACSEVCQHVYMALHYIII
jgi:hypothetical protein